TAGQFGEVAATLLLPLDLRVGSHTVTLTGGASGQAAQTLFTVRQDASLVSAAQQPDAALVGQTRHLSAWEIAAIIAAVLFVLVLVGTLSAAAAQRSRRRRRIAKKSSQDPRGVSDENV
ncbi:MAG: hypothetical protein LBG70_00400, partial [Bifidobacteriaceae bacterium]|nr:hypothetical protein [Bifidobacteriaceae bacterium]